MLQAIKQGFGVVVACADLLIMQGGAVFQSRPLGAKRSTQTRFVQSFSRTLQVMDVCAENRGCPHQKVRFSAAQMMGRNFLIQGHPGVKVRNVRGTSRPKNLCLCFFFPAPCSFQVLLVAEEGETLTAILGGFCLLLGHHHLVEETPGFLHLPLKLQEMD